MDLLALGPLELWDQERQFDLGPLKQRRLLAALLHARGDPVPAGTLVERVWGAAPLPASPEASLQGYLSRLRAVLHEAGGDRLRVDRVDHPSRRCYRLRFDPEDVDLLRFQRLREEAARAAERGDLQLAVGKLHTAESEWSGEPLAEFTCHWAVSLRARLREGLRRVQQERLRLEMEMEREMARERGAATDGAMDGATDGDRHVGILGELRELAARHALDPQSVGLLMVALHRSGRTDEALEAQGIEPGAGLRELRRRPR